MPTIDIDGYTFHYRERGSGPLVIFIHGFPLDSTMWLDQMKALSSLRRCVAVDLRGFGLSDPVTVDSLTMEQHADDVAAVIDALGEAQADVIGLSMGGYVALAFAERHAAKLRTLTLVDTKATPDTDAGKAGRDVAAVNAVVRGRSAVADEMSEALLGPRASLTAKARLRTMIESTRVETIVAALEGMKQRPDRSGVLSSINVPAAVIVGEHDRIAPVPEAEAMAEALPNAKLVVVSDAGHMAPIEAAETVNRALLDLLR